MHQILTFSNFKNPYLVFLSSDWMGSMWQKCWDWGSKTADKNLWPYFLFPHIFRSFTAGPPESFLPCAYFDYSRPAPGGNQDYYCATKDVDLKLCSLVEGLSEGSRGKNLMQIEGKMGEISWFVLATYNWKVQNNQKSSIFCRWTLKLDIANILKSFDLKLFLLGCLMTPLLGWVGLSLGKSRVPDLFLMAPKAFWRLLAPLCA